MNINITKLKKSITTFNENPVDIQKLFKAAGEINEDHDGVFKLMIRPSGLVINPTTDNSVVKIYCGLRWVNYEDDSNGVMEIADIVLFYETETNMLTAAACCGRSYTPDEWTQIYS